MFGVGLPELMVLLVVAVFVFGPDRLPEFARQAGRFLRQVRQFADSARDDIRRELGPEYSNLQLSDLDPRTVIRKHILEAMEEDPDDAVAAAGTSRPLEDGERPPYDVDAT